MKGRLSPYGGGRRDAQLIVGLVCLAVLGLPSIASANTPWWHLTSTSRPTYLPSEGVGTIVLGAENFGDAKVGSAKSPINVEDSLPAGLKALSIVGSKTVVGNTTTPLTCTLATLTCTLLEPLAPYQQLEVRIKVSVQPGAHSGEVNGFSVSGGGAAPSSLQRPITVSEELTPFGVDDFELRAEEEGGTLTTHAGSHPFQVTGTFIFNQGKEAVGNNGHPEVFPISLPKDINTLLPPGLVGDPTPLPTCGTAQFTHLFVGGGPGGNPEEDECPSDTAIGVAAVSVEEPSLAGYIVLTVPVFNLQPAFGEPARFGFALPIGHTQITLDTALRSGPGEDYGITVSSLNTSQQAGVLSAQVTFWGVPGDPRHDSSRGWSCLSESEELTHGLCVPSTDPHPPAFLTMPTSCDGPLNARAQVNSWNNPSLVEAVRPAEPLQSLDSCNQLPFAPELSAEPTTDRASAPSGLNLNLDWHDDGLTAAEGAAQSELKETVVTLPEGLTVNPSSGVGLAGCTPADYERETINSAPGAGCPNESKLGTVEAETPLLKQKLHGNIFIAQPYENPFNSLIGLYLVFKNPETGILIKLAGKVTPDPVTGRLTTTFENLPPTPLNHFNFHFREGQQAPLITPPTCGTFETQAVLSPFSEPTSPLTVLSAFQITKGYDGGACPGGTPPFSPDIAAGMINNNAGAYSPFYLHLTRSDGDSEISSFSTNLPEGLTGDLTGIPFCSEADIALSRVKTGVQEEAEPSCPAASKIGHTLVGTGVGAVLAYTSGKVYLAGPFHGAPFSLVSVTSAVVGPFDLGTVVLRFGLNIDPYTAQVSVSPTTSEPIPTILQGIVTHVRDIRVYIERPGGAPFTLNPTSCNRMAISSTLQSNLSQSATASSPFQTANCTNLKFAPKFAVSTAAKTSKANGASLHVDLTYPQAPQGTYADIAKVKVELPKQLPSRLTTLQKACTAAQFEVNPAGCPSPSVIGSARAVVPNIPEALTGPVYFVSHGGEAFPSLEVVLQGYGVKVILVGATFISKSGITSTTFKAIPDNPVSSFELTLPEGQYSALAANGNLCTQKLTMPADFTGQNGLEADYETPVSVTGCKPAITVKSHKVKGKTATIAIAVPAAGRLVATSKGLSKGSGKIAKAGTVTVKLTLTKSEVAFLSKHKTRKLRAKINLTFTPKSGSKLKISTTVLIG
jgi:hypothetical protein